MRSIVPHGFLLLGLLTGCATGTEEAPSHDAGKKSDAESYTSAPDAGASHVDAGNPYNNNPSPQPEAGPPTCNGTMCGAQCVDTTSDDNNCGSCGNTCPSGSSCTSSACVCGSGTLCSGACVDTSSDNNNCGACGTTCSATETCTSGACTATSNAPPQGSCSHSLCVSGTKLTDGCDTDGCTTVICDYVGDTYCCDTKWDATCESEVTSYCSPYSCM